MGSSPFLQLQQGHEQYLFLLQLQSRSITQFITNKPRNSMHFFRLLKTELPLVTSEATNYNFMTFAMPNLPYLLYFISLDLFLGPDITCIYRLQNKVTSSPPRQKTYPCQISASWVLPVLRLYIVQQQNPTST